MFNIDTANLEELQDAATSDWDIVEHFISLGLDPQRMNDVEKLRGILQEWVEDGDECA